MSRVKEYNNRYNAKYSEREPYVIRSTVDFKSLQAVIFSFLDSFPRDLKDPFQAARVEVPLLMALNIGWMSVNTCFLTGHS
jgi:hypothetical protein